MKVELTQQQADLINEALGHALLPLPASQRVVVAVMDYAPILQALQQAAQPVGGSGDNRPPQSGHMDEKGLFVPDALLTDEK